MIGHFGKIRTNPRYSIHSGGPFDKLTQHQQNIFHFCLLPPHAPFNSITLHTFYLYAAPFTDVTLGSNYSILDVTLELELSMFS